MMAHLGLPLLSWAVVISVSVSVSVSAVNGAVLPVAEHTGVEWTLVEKMAGADFWTHFDFFTAPDPTHGYISYVSEDQCR
jgi:hypothetical protein